jgi:hypothetical protein
MSVEGVSRRARALLRETAPGYVGVWRTLRYLARARAQLDRGVGFKVGKRYAWEVVAGPFAGLRYPWWACGCVLTGPKILGCYEAELQTVVEEVVRRGYRTIVNIGSAEGYYTIGLARRLPGTTVHAFETSPVIRRLCADLCRMNGVEGNVRLHAGCTPEALRLLGLEGALVLCDIEGGELGLIDPALVSQLSRCDLLVELHDGANQSITPTLTERLAPTHELRFIAATGKRDAETHARVDFLAEPERLLAVNEFRRISRGWLLAIRREADQ